MKPLILTVTEDHGGDVEVSRFEITVDPITNEAQICSTRSGHAMRGRDVEITVGYEPTQVTLRIGVELGYV